jgi:outer membrane protein
LKKLVVLSFILGISFTKMVAQQALSLKDCVQYGLEHDLTVARNTAEMDYIAAQEKEAYSAIYPTINGKVQYTNNIVLPTSLIPAKTFNPRASDDDFTEIKFGVNNTLSPSVEVSQILYNQAVNLSVKAIRAARALGTISIEKAKEGLVFNIAQAYLSLLVLRKQAKLLTVNAEKLDKTIKVLQATVDNGFAKPIDVKRLMVAKTNLKTELDNIHIGDEQLQIALKFAMNMPLETPIILKDSIESIQLTNTGNAAGHSIDIDLLQAQKALLGIQNEVVKSGYYPSAAAFASAQTQAQRQNFDFYDTAKRWFPSAVAGVVINIPIYDGGQKKAKLAQGNIRIKQNDLDQETVKNAVSLQTRMANLKLETLKNTLITQKNNIDLADEVLAVTQEQYKAGYSPLTDIINAETALREAQAYYTKTIADMKIAELEIIKANGSLMTVLAK